VWRLVDWVLIGLAVLGVVVLLVWDADSESPQHIDPAMFPLVEGAEVAASAEDPGVDYTTEQKPERYLLVLGPPRWSDAQLKTAEAKLVAEREWRVERPPTRRQVRARAPDDDVTAMFLTAREARLDDAHRRWRFGVPEEMEATVRKAERGGRPAIVVRLTRRAAAP
jgi:hypothetical protein